MVGLVSGRVWASIPEDDREIIARLMGEYVDACLQAYVDLEDDFLAEVEKTDITIRPVTADFFSEAVSAWNEEWEPKAPNLPALRALVE
jgi:TRAP-type C4-dicarboxylate transport system substrate-binding protein